MARDRTGFWPSHLVPERPRAPAKEADPRSRPLSQLYDLRLTLAIIFEINYHLRNIWVPGALGRTGPVLLLTPILMPIIKDAFPPDTVIQGPTFKPAASNSTSAVRSGGAWTRHGSCRQHIRGGRVQFRQAKNEHRNPIDIDIPLHPALAERNAATKVGNMTFLITEYGKPFTANGNSETSSRTGVAKPIFRAARRMGCARPHQPRSRKLAQRRTR